MSERSGHYAITNVRTVLPERLLDDATVVVEDDRIAAVTDGRVATPPERIDGGGGFLLPGLIDTHSDGVEREIWPRPTASFPIDFALRVFEGRLQAAGVTTVFHGVGFQDNESYQRSVAQAVELCAVIDERRAGDDVPCDHQILHRLEARHEPGWDACVARLPADPGTSPLPLLSFEDHSPGQGQYRDLDPDGEAEARRGLRDKHLAAVSRLADSKRIRLLAHDLEDAEQVAEAAGWGATVAEFPVSEGAAAEARRREMPVVLGAPNVMRGGSHSGNVGAEELIARGLCTSLASDYQPATLLAAVFALVDRGTCTMPAAVALVTSGAAEVAGLDDRGSLAVGTRADLALVDRDGGWPRVRRFWRAA